MCHAVYANTTHLIWKSSVRVFYKYMVVCKAHKIEHTHKTYVAATIIYTRCRIRKQVVARCSSAIGILLTVLWVHGWADQICLITLILHPHKLRVLSILHNICKANGCVWNADCLVVLYVYKIYIYVYLKAQTRSNILKKIAYNNFTQV